MIVLDASAAVELLLHTQAGTQIAARLGNAGTIHCPHLIDVEIAQALRRLAARGDISEQRAAVALAHWTSLDVERYSHADFLDRIWALRGNVSAYDAAYLALAEILAAPLITGDRRLAAVPVTSAQIECFPL